MSALAEKKYIIIFHDAMEKEHSSNCLRVKKIHEALPLDVKIPFPSANWEGIECQKLSEDVADQDEEEALVLGAN